MLTRPMQRLWRDQRGFVATTDLILIFTIVMLGTIVGLATLRNSVVQEFGDLGAAVGKLDQSYYYIGNSYGLNNNNNMGGQVAPLFVPDSYAWVPGSSFTDLPDFCDDDDVAGEPPAGISVTVPPTPEGQGL